MRFGLSAFLLTASLATAAAADTANTLTLDPVDGPTGATSGTGNVVRLGDAPARGGTNIIDLTILGDRNGGAGGAFSARTGTRLMPGTLFQSGNDNRATLAVEGSDNLFALSQTGTGNIAVVAQAGSGNVVAVVQRGR